MKVCELFGCAISVASIACSFSEPYLCSVNADCPDGRCELSGFCSFPTDDCPSGRRYGRYSAPSLAGECVLAPHESEVETETTGSLPDASTYAGGSTMHPEASSSSSEDFVPSSATSTDEGTTALEIELPSDFVAHYRFRSNGRIDDPFESLLEDESDNELHAACVTCPLVSQGVQGTAARFTGEEHVVVLFDPLLEPSQLSVSYWLKIEPFGPGLMHVVGKPVGEGSRNSYESFAYFTESSGLQVRFVIGNQAGSFQVITAYPDDGDFHHVAGVFDGARVSVYLDGVLQDTMDGAVIEYDQADVYLGSDLDFGAPNHPLVGVVDELFFFDRPLLPAEIDALATR